MASRRAAAAATASSSTTSTGGKDVLDIQMEGWKEREGMRDAGQSALVDGIHERNAFTNTTGQVVYMPASQQRVFQLPNSVYVGTNDAFFNPLQDTGEFGTELQRHQYGQ